MTIARSVVASAIAGLVCFSCVSAQATTYYIDYSSGSDSSSGTTVGTPWKHCPGDINATVNALAKTPAPGDTLLFKGGVTYQFLSTGTAQNIAAKASGTATQPITYQSGHKCGTPWGTGRAVIDGTYANVAYNARMGILDLRNYQYITVDGLDIGNNINGLSDYVGGIGFIANSTNPGGNITINDCCIHDCKSSGIIIQGLWGPGQAYSANFNITNNEICHTYCHTILIRASVENVTVRGNILHDGGTYNNGGTDAEWNVIKGSDSLFLAMGDAGNGPDTLVTPRTILFANNEVYNFPEKGFMCASAWDDLTIEGNYLHGSVFFGLSTMATINHCANNCMIRNNVIVCLPSTVHGYGIQGAIGTYHDGNGYSKLDGLKIYNNTIVGGSGGFLIYLCPGTSTQPDAVTNAVIKNNILCTTRGSEYAIYCHNSQVTQGLVAANNIYYYDSLTTKPFYWLGAGCTYANWCSATGDTGSINNQDPKLVNMGGNDFRLQSVSPCIDLGINLGGEGFSMDKNGISRPRGPGWDMGAYEYDGASGNSITDFVVQSGLLERSFVRDVTLTFASATGVQDLITYNRIQLTKCALDGTGGTAMSLVGLMTANGNQITLDFGLAGLGGNPNSAAGDGYCDLALDMDADGTFEAHRHFYRLAGDVDGDGVVTTSDANTIRAAYGHTGELVNEDANGDNTVNAADRTLAIRNIGHQLAAGLIVDD